MYSCLKDLLELKASTADDGSDRILSGHLQQVSCTVNHLGVSLVAVISIESSLLSALAFLNLVTLKNIYFITC